MSTSTRPYHHGDLRSALLDEAMRILESEGAAALSLREVARRLGVSHNAPYRHFPTREALLAALAARGFEEMGARLAAAQASGERPMEARALAHVSFALERPALFRLMFSGQVGGEAAQASLADAASAVRSAFGAESLDDATLSAWAFVHGLAGLLLDGAVPDAMRAGRSDRQLAKDAIAAMAHALGER